jgi:formylglycine-generating enzyme required for sulfatase activity
VVGLSAKDARAYASWLAAVTGRSIRLPSADEWEKSVRAADGRTYPWGDRWGRSFCASVLTCQPAEFPPPVGTFAEDCSPFGVCDAAGGVWEWTNDCFDDSALVVGGAVISEAGGCRIAGRRSVGVDSKLRFLGFRVLMELAT